MVRVAIDTRRLNDFPDVCIKTGEPARHTRRQTFADIPGWTLLLIFWGVIPFLIAAGFARNKVRVDLPASEETLRRLRLTDLGALAGLFVALALVVLAAAIQEPGFALAGIIVLVAALLVSAALRGRFWVSGRLEDGVLWLYGVDPGFAELVRSFIPPTGTPRAPANPRVAVLWLAVLVPVLAGIIWLFQRA